MAAKKILVLLDSDRYSAPLIEFITSNAKIFDWKIKIASFSDPNMLQRIMSEPFADQVECSAFSRFQECEQAIKKTDLVMALVQDAILLQIADICIAMRKTLISPARLTKQMAMKKALAKDSNALILMDCGFSPGLDHIIAKKAIDNIHSKGGQISSFKTYSGSVLAETSSPNPWHFKLTEPVLEMLSWGKHNNRHLLNGRLQHIPCYRLFERTESVVIRDQQDLVVVPEGDSLYYKRIYNLQDAHTVVKGKLIRQPFNRIWNLLVKLGLTDASSKLDMGSQGSYYNFIDSMLPSGSGSIEDRIRQYTGADEQEIENLKWIGLFDTTPWNDMHREVSPAQILQTLLQQKITMQSDDRDCLIMEHQLTYQLRDEEFEMNATLTLKGETEKHSALAKVIGFMCGAAAKSVLLGTIKIKGLHIPILRELYDPILNELEDLGIAFHVTETKRALAEVL